MDVSESKIMAETVLWAYQIAEDEGKSISRRFPLETQGRAEIQTFLLSGQYLMVLIENPETCQGPS